MAIHRWFDHGCSCKCNTTFHVDEQPYRCPICNGKGKVQQGFYDTVNYEYISTTGGDLNEICRTCSGSGVIWK